MAGVDEAAVARWPARWSRRRSSSTSCSPSRAWPIQSADGPQAREALRRDPRQGPVLLHRRGEPRRDRPPQHPASHAAGHAARRQRPAASSHARAGGRQPPARLPMPAEAIVKGDAKVPAISAASILAKVTRDRQCLTMHETYPAYGFATPTRATPRPSTWRRCASTAPAPGTGSALRPCESRSNEPIHVSSRDNLSSCACASSRLTAAPIASLAACGSKVTTCCARGAAAAGRPASSC